MNSVKLYKINDTYVSRDDYIDYCLQTIFDRLEEISRRLPPENSSGLPTCSRCGKVLRPHEVAEEGDKWVHKGECPEGTTVNVWTKPRTLVRD